MAQAGAAPARSLHSASAPPDRADDDPGARWALMLGNFAIGCGVMVVPGALNDIARDLAVTPASAGQLITVGAWALAIGAPLLAAALSGWDRRLLLTLSLLWFAAGHALAALMPNLATLMPVRAAGVLAAAVFTPQAAATIGALVAPSMRGRAITFVFLGWSLASVLGITVASLVADAAGWRWAFGLVSLTSLATAAGVWWRVPSGLKPVPLAWRDWSGVISNPRLVAMVAVTALAALGMFTLFSYQAPYYRDVLQADAGRIGLLFFWFGGFGLVGNLLMARWIDRLGAGHAASLAFAAMTGALALWPLAIGVAGFLGAALAIVPWALGCFSSNSAQQARMAAAAPSLTAALVSLNTSAMYLGQGLGAATGGLLLTLYGYGALAPMAALGIGLGLALSLWVGRGTVSARSA